MSKRLYGGAAHPTEAVAGELQSTKGGCLGGALCRPRVASRRRHEGSRYSPIKELSNGLRILSEVRVCQYMSASPCGGVANIYVEHVSVEFLNRIMV
jgi:hypothetical protein